MLWPTACVRCPGLLLLPLHVRLDRLCMMWLQPHQYVGHTASMSLLVSSRLVHGSAVDAFTITALAKGHVC
jgi:hypothetical protein